MITYQGKKYGVSYAGNVAFEEIPGASLTVDAWGLDSISRRYKGALDLLPAFLQTLKRNRFKADDIYPGLTLGDYQVTEGYFPEVVVNYKGTHDGTMPAPMPPATDMTVETASLSLFDGAEADSPTVEVTYYAPTTTWRYVARERPLTPRFFGKLEGNQEIRYIQRRGASGEIRIFAGGNLGDSLGQNGFTQVLGQFNGVAVTVTKGPKVTPAGIYFECEEQVQRLLMPYSLYNLVWQIPANIPAWGNGHNGFLDGQA